MRDNDTDTRSERRHLSLGRESQTVSSPFPSTGSETDRLLKVKGALAVSLRRPGSPGLPQRIGRVQALCVSSDGPSGVPTVSHVPPPTIVKEEMVVLSWCLTLRPRER